MCIRDSLNVASNTQPLPETFSEYRNRTGNNNISEQSFTPTPKKKFNVPKNTKVKVKNSSGQKFYADYIAEGVVIKEIGDNDFVFEYPNGRRVTSTSLGRSNAPTLEGRFDALVIEKERVKKEDEIRKKKAKEDKKKREEERRLRDIEWAKRFPNLYNPDGTRK